ncbi:hypothetical protein L204_106195 [Cryptococcus depauperatus]
MGQLNRGLVPDRLSYPVISPKKKSLFSSIKLRKAFTRMTSQIFASKTTNSPKTIQPLIAPATPRFNPKIPTYITIPSHPVLLDRMHYRDYSRDSKPTSKLINSSYTYTPPLPRNAQTEPTGVIARRASWPTYQRSCPVYKSLNSQGDDYKILEGILYLKKLRDALKRDLGETLNVPSFSPASPSPSTSSDSDLRRQLARLYLTDEARCKKSIHRVSLEYSKSMTELRMKRNSKRPSLMRQYSYVSLEQDEEVIDSPESALKPEDPFMFSKAVEARFPAPGAPRPYRKYGPRPRSLPPVALSKIVDELLFEKERVKRMKTNGLVISPRSDPSTPAFFSPGSVKTGSSYFSASTEHITRSGSIVDLPTSNTIHGSLVSRNHTQAIAARNRADEAIYSILFSALSRFVSQVKYGFISKFV